MISKLSPVFLLNTSPIDFIDLLPVDIYMPVTAKIVNELNKNNTQEVIASAVNNGRLLGVNYDNRGRSIILSPNDLLAWIFNNHNNASDCLNKVSYGATYREIYSTNTGINMTGIDVLLVDTTEQAVAVRFPIVGAMKTVKWVAGTNELSLVISTGYIEGTNSFIVNNLYEVGTSLDFICHTQPFSTTESTSINWILV